MSAYIVVYVVLSVLSGIAVYAAVTPVHRPSRGQYKLGASEKDASNTPS